MCRLLKKIKIKIEDEGTQQRIKKYDENKKQNENNIRISCNICMPYLGITNSGSKAIKSISQVSNIQCSNHLTIFSI